jgi:hypothetical protein
MVELVQPWLTLQTFEGTDRETLSNLQKQCGAISDKLDHDFDGWKWALGALLLFLAAGASFFIVQLLANLQSLSLSAGLTWMQRHPVISLSVILPLFLLALALVMRSLLRTARSE